MSDRCAAQAAECRLPGVAAGDFRRIFGSGLDAGSKADGALSVRVALTAECICSRHLCITDSKGLDMTRFRVCFLIMAASAFTATRVTAADISENIAVQLRDKAMAGRNVAYSWVSELTTRVGPRPAGSTNEHLAAAWAADKLKALGFENVRIETFPLTAWVRGTEHAELVAPNAQPLMSITLVLLWCAGRPAGD
jgi:hypothetical protein